MKTKRMKINERNEFMNEIPKETKKINVHSFKNWKKEPLLFWPTFLFFAFHTYFPNKQERFILPVIPMIIIAGFIGAHQIVSKYEWNSKKWFKNAIVFCCVLI